MTVSHLFYDFTVFDASVNYEDFKKGKVNKLPYIIDDKVFKTLLRSIALGTKASFSYKPTEEEIKRHVAVKKKIKLSKIEQLELTEEEIIDAE